MLYSEKIGGIVYAEVYRNAAVSYSVPAGSAVFEDHILALLRTALYGGVDIRTCQRNSACVVHSRHDMGIGATGDRDAGNRISHKSLLWKDMNTSAGHSRRRIAVFWNIPPVPFRKKTFGSWQRAYSNLTHRRKRYVSIQKRQVPHRRSVLHHP